MKIKKLFFVGLVGVVFGMSAASWAEVGIVVENEESAAVSPEEDVLQSIVGRKVFSASFDADEVFKLNQDFQISSKKKIQIEMRQIPNKPVLAIAISFKNVLNYQDRAIGWASRNAERGFYDFQGTYTHAFIMEPEPISGKITVPLSEKGGECEVCLEWEDHRLTGKTSILSADREWLKKAQERPKISESWRTRTDGNGMIWFEPPPFLEDRPAIQDPKTGSDSLVAPPGGTPPNPPELVAPPPPAVAPVPEGRPYNKNEQTV